MPYCNYSALGSSGHCGGEGAGNCQAFFTFEPVESALSYYVNSDSPSCCSRLHSDTSRNRAIRRSVLRNIQNATPFQHPHRWDRIDCFGCCFSYNRPGCPHACAQASPYECGKSPGGRMLSIPCPGFLGQGCGTLKKCDNILACCEYTPTGHRCYDARPATCVADGNVVPPRVLGRAEGRCGDFASPDPCGTACCADAGCIETSPAECLGLGGEPIGDIEFSGQSVPCTEDTCEGGCCFCGRCCNMAASECRQLGGTPIGQRCIDESFPCLGLTDDQIFPACSVWDFGVSEPSRFGRRTQMAPVTLHEVSRITGSCNFLVGEFFLEPGSSTVEVNVCIETRRRGDPEIERYVGSAVIQDDQPFTTFQVELNPVCPQVPVNCQN